MDVLCSEFMEEELTILSALKEFEKDRICSSQKWSFVYGDAMQIEEDEIILHTKNILTKLAISHIMVLPIIQSYLTNSCKTWTRIDALSLYDRNQ